jgi:hypothetical protein
MPKSLRGGTGREEWQLKEEQETGRGYCYRTCVIRSSAVSADGKVAV